MKAAAFAHERPAGFECCVGLDGQCGRHDQDHRRRPVTWPDAQPAAGRAGSDRRYIRTFRTEAGGAQLAMNSSIGACITHGDIEDGRMPDVTRRRHAAGRRRHRLSRAVRNRGTIGGSRSVTPIPLRTGSQRLAALRASASPLRGCLQEPAISCRSRILSPARWNPRCYARRDASRLCAFRRLTPSARLGICQSLPQAGRVRPRDRGCADRSGAR